MERQELLGTVLSTLKSIAPEVDADELVADLPPCLPQTGNRIRSQNARLRDVIRRFGRHPHRNAVLGRISTLDEEAYIASGDFPHVAKGPRPA